MPEVTAAWSAAPITMTFSVSSATTTLTNMQGMWWPSGTTNYFGEPIRMQPSTITSYDFRAQGTRIDPTRELTPEEEAARREREAERDRQMEERLRIRDEASGRARELLLALLDDTQRASYEETSSFEIVGSAGNRYRINRGANGNVLWLDDDEVRGRLCAHPDFVDGYLPDADVALAQMLALTTDEAAWLQRANVHAGRRPPIPIGTAA